MAGRYFTLAVVVMLASMAFAQGQDTKGDADGSGSPGYRATVDIAGDEEGRLAAQALELAVTKDLPLSSPVQGLSGAYAPSPQVQIPGGDAASGWGGMTQWGVALAAGKGQFDYTSPNCVCDGLLDAGLRVMGGIMRILDPPAPPGVSREIIFPGGDDLPAWAIPEAGGRVVLGPNPAVEELARQGLPAWGWTGKIDASFLVKTPGFGQEIGQIDAWSKGDMAYIEWTNIGSNENPLMRNQGYGSEAYHLWESRLPTSVKEIGLNSMGKPHEFWLRQGFKDTGEIGPMGGIEMLKKLQ